MVQPLSQVAVGDRTLLREVRSRHETRHFLESLGFVPGTELSVVCASAGNLIVAVRDARVAVSRAMAHDIVVEANPTVAQLCATCPAASARTEAGEA